MLAEYPAKHQCTQVGLVRVDRKWYHSRQNVAECLSDVYTIVTIPLSVSVRPQFATLVLTKASDKSHLDIMITEPRSNRELLGTIQQI